MMQKPDVDQIDGLSPAISIEQKTTSKNPRSTVGTVTEIYDYMRLLWARIGVPYSPATGLPIESQTVSQMVDRVLALPEGTRLYLLAPVVRGRKGEYRKELAEFLKKGYQRVKIDGAFYEIGEVPAARQEVHPRHRRGGRPPRGAPRHRARGSRIRSSSASSSPTAGGRRTRRHQGDRRRRPIAGRNENAERLIFSEKFACPVSGFTIPEIEPRLFSFNNPFGACPACGGLGVEQHIDADLVIPDNDATLAQGRDRALGEIVARPITSRRSTRSASTTASRSTPSGRTCRRRRRTPSCTAPARTRSSSPMTTACAATRPRSRSRASSPISSAAARKPRATGRARSCRNISPTCPAPPATASRLKPEALCVKIAGKHIGEVAELSVKRAGEWFTELPKHLTAEAERDRASAC